MTGTYAFGAIMTALNVRHKTGRGQAIDVTMLETMLSLLGPEVQTSQFDVAPPGRPMFGPVRTKDGFIMPAVASERSFQGICRAAGRMSISSPLTPSARISAQALSLVRSPVAKPGIV